MDNPFRVVVSTRYPIRWTNRVRAAIHQCKSATSPHSYKFHAHRCTARLSVRLMDAASPSLSQERERGRETARGREGVAMGRSRGIGEGNAGRVAGVSLGKQGMTRNVRPDREIQHASDPPPRYPPSRPYIPAAITFPGCCLHLPLLYRPVTYAPTIGKISIFGPAAGPVCLRGELSRDRG